MGVGGKFWDILKPYARNQGPDYLRNKRVAVDLSYWIVQHETALLNSFITKPHLRLTFFRTILLFSKFGAFPVFVVDGTPSPLKSRARMERFFRSSGVDVSSFPVAEEGVSVERNRAFLKCVQDCVELLELFGMPVLKAVGEAEALCAQLNREGHVDACITADSDSFLYGAHCVIKSLKPNSKEPFECYHISDIEVGLGLKRKHLIAISLLVGNDHDLNGVQGIGLETALRLVQRFTEDEILNKLHEIGNGNTSLFQDCSKVVMVIEDENSPKSKTSHCSFCGHPGRKSTHFRSSCEYCGNNTSESCTKKPDGFKCNCPSCDKDRKQKEQKRHENWQIKVCSKISMEPNFPNDDIIQMYLRNSHGNFTADVGQCISWKSPDIDMLVDFLVLHRIWDPSYIRQKMIPMLSTTYLREMAGNVEKTLLYEQYEFDSIQRIKTRYGHQSYVIKWRKAARTVGSGIDIDPFCEESDMQQEEIIDVDEIFEELNEDDVTHIHVDDGKGFLLTDENMELVYGAFPEEVDRFLREKQIKESKRRNSSSLRSKESNKLESLKSKGIQLNITEFYRSTKLQVQAKGDSMSNNSENGDEGKSKGKRKATSPSLPKSVRRHLLFK